MEMRPALVEWSSAGGFYFNTEALIRLQIEAAGKRILLLCSKLFVSSGKIGLVPSTPLTIL